MQIRHGATALLLSLMLTGCTGLGLVEGRAWVDHIPLATPPFQTMPDGTYQGRYTIAVPAGAVVMARRFEVRVTLSSPSGTRRLSSIEVDQPASFPDPTFLPTMTSRVLAAQLVTVDGVSGATYSSRSFLKAVENALTR